MKALHAPLGPGFVATVLLTAALPLLACKTTSHGGESPSARSANGALIESKLKSLMRVNLFGSSAGKGYFITIDLEQETIEGAWSEEEKGRKKIVTQEGNAPLDDARVDALKNALAAIRELPEAEACDQGGEDLQNLVLADSEGDIFFEVVAEGRNRCTGPYVDREGFQRLLKLVEEWLPPSARKLSEETQN